MTALDPRSTALVLIDLQKGILGRELAPRSAGDVLASGRTLAERFRAAGAPVVLVRVSWAEDMADAPRQPVDAPSTVAGAFPAGWDQLADGLAEPGDIVVTKKQWGAFYGTDLDLQLRRRGVRTIVLGGIATNFGVESTARSAWEQGYEVILVEDACATASAELHDMAIRHIFPRIARIKATADIAF
jgi:nicotinamidase-related amidase